MDAAAERILDVPPGHPESLVYALRAAGADLCTQLEALRAEGLSFEEASSSLLTPGGTRRERLLQALRHVDSGSDLRTVRRILACQQIHPASFAFTQDDPAEAFRRMGLSESFAAWKVTKRAVRVEGTRHLCALPQGFEFLDKTLELKNLPYLEDLGEGLRVRTLDVDRCLALHRFPTGFRCRDAVVRNCASFRGPGKDNFIQRSLTVVGCPEFEGPPEPGALAGSLSVRGSGGEVLFPAGFSVPQNLDLESCERLRSLPPGIKTGQDLALTLLPALAELPAGIEVGRDLVISDCSALEQLPADLKVGGNLHLVRLRSLRSLPRGLKVGRDLLVHQCPAFASIAEGLEVGGALFLETLPSFSRWEGPAMVGRAFSVHGLPRLGRLPEGLHVGGRPVPGYPPPLIDLRMQPGPPLDDLHMMFRPSEGGAKACSLFGVE